MRPKVKENDYHLLLNDNHSHYGVKQFLLIAQKKSREMIQNLRYGPKW